MNCRERLEQYFRENGVGYEALQHPQAYTMSEVAAALHVSGKQVAKVVMVKADGKPAMLVVASPYRLDFAKARDLLGAKEVVLAREEEFADLFPDCATGAMPPFGNLYGVPVYVDEALAAQKEMVFRVGSHNEAMRLAYQDFARLVQPQVGAFAKLA